MNITLSQFLTALIYSVVSGFCFGILYEIIRIFRFLGFVKDIHFIISDTLFVVLISVYTYIYCLVTLEGSVRFYVIFGEIFGFTVYMIFVAPLTKKLLEPATKFFKKILLNLLKKCNKILYNIFCSVSKGIVSVKFVFKNVFHHTIDKVICYEKRRNHKRKNKKTIKKPKQRKHFTGSKA